MSTRPRILGIDIGTSGLRVAALSADGTVVGVAGSAFAADEKADPTAWWRALERSMAELSARNDLGSVVALAVDGTSGTVLAVDDDGRPLDRASLYDAPAPADELAAIRAVAPEESLARSSTSPLARAAALRGRILHQADWLAGRLAGRFGWTDENNALKTGHDPAARRWPDWIASVIDPDRLPVVLEPGSAVGRVGPEAVALGLPASATVHAGTTDGCAAFLATGAAEPGEAVTSLGSTIVVKLASDRPILAPAYGVYSHRIGRLWLAGGASNAGGAVLASLFDRDRLAELGDSVDPDRPTGLDYYPLTRPGERFPIDDPTLAPRLLPRPDDERLFFQGVLEGLTRIEALAYRRLAELGAPPLGSVRTVGGGAANTGWRRLRERALGVPFPPAISEEASVGVARLVLARLTEEGGP